MSKCQALDCTNEAVWHWQPTIGADSGDYYTMTLMGWFYRGWPVINLCQQCADKLRQTKTIKFRYHRQLFSFNDGKTEKIKC